MRTLIKLYQEVTDEDSNVVPSQADIDLYEVLRGEKPPHPMTTPDDTTGKRSERDE